MTGNRPAIRCEKLCKSFGNNEILRDLDLTVEPGERIAIIGPSGCGKSVFLRLLERLEEPTSGRIFIGDAEITARHADVDAIRRRLGMVYQGFHLFEHLNVLDNLTLAPRVVLGLSRRQAEERALELLKTVSLENRRAAFPAELSGGQRQRIAIARSLAMEPEVLLFDEPTSALDPGMVGEVLATIRLLAKQSLTMLIVTHEMHFARELATRVLYFDRGGIREQGTPEEIFDRPREPETRGFIRKLKHFTEHLDRRDFDLLKVHGGIELFCQKYGLSPKLNYHLQLCVEELVFELIENACAGQDAVSIDLSIEYGELTGDLSLEVVCAGTCYNPFDAKILPELGDHLGVVLLKKIARKIDFRYEAGHNRFAILLRGAEPVTPPPPLSVRSSQDQQEPMKS